MFQLGCHNVFQLGCHNVFQLGCHNVFQLGCRHVCLVLRDTLECDLGGCGGAGPGCRALCLVSEGEGAMWRHCLCGSGSIHAWVDRCGSGSMQSDQG